MTLVRAHLTDEELLTFLLEELPYVPTIPPSRMLTAPEIRKGRVPKAGALKHYQCVIPDCPFNPVTPNRFCLGHRSFLRVEYKFFLATAKAQNRSL